MISISFFKDPNLYHLNVSCFFTVLIFMDRDCYVILQCLQFSKLFTVFICSTVLIGKLSDAIQFITGNFNFLLALPVL